MATASLLGAALRAPTGHGLRWRGQAHPLRFGDVELELSDGTELCRWAAVIAFSAAPIQYPILGLSGTLQYFDVTFLGDDRLVRWAVNRSFAGTVA